MSVWVDSPNAIDQIAERIQGLSGKDRWVHAQPDAILAVGHGAAPRRGRWTRRMDRMIAVSRSMGLTHQLVAAVSLLLTLTIYLAQFRILPRRPESTPLLFVGIGALNERELMARFEVLNGRRAERLNEFEATSFFRLRRVKLIALIRELNAVWGELWPTLDRARAEEGLDVTTCAVFAAKRTHSYAYFRAWFRQWIDDASIPVRVGFSAASYFSYAAVAVGCRASFFMHGFQRRSTVYPDFTEVHCFNRFEAEHARRRLPEANVVLVSNVVDTVQTRSRCVIAGVYGLPHSQEGCRSFIEWARGSKLPVIVKRHPRDRSIFWDGWKGTDGVEQLDEPIGFAEFLRTHQPRFMATWYSTTLLDALLMGIVPITFAATAPDADDVVFPFREVALRWPEDRATIRSLADDPVACDAFVRRLRAGILGVAEELQGPPPPAALS